MGEEGTTGGRWGFLGTHTPEMVAHYKKDITYPDILEDMVPMGPQNEVTTYQPDVFRGAVIYFEPEMRRAARGAKLLPHEKLSVAITQQLYGIPEEQCYAGQTIDYCRFAMGLLRDDIPAIGTADFDWTAVRQGDDFSGNAQGRGFIVFGFYNVQRGTATSQPDGQLKIECQRWRYNEGGASASQCTPVPAGNKRGQFIVVGTGRRSMINPFSEALHYHISDRMHAHAQRAGMSNSYFAAESFAEGMAAAEALKASKVAKIPDGERTILGLIEEAGSNPDYRAVRRSFEWVLKNGTRGAFELYMEDPDKFMQAIGTPDQI